MVWHCQRSFTKLILSKLTPLLPSLPTHHSHTCCNTSFILYLLVALKWLVELMDLDTWSIADGYALSGSNPVF